MKKETSNFNNGILNDTCFIYTYFVCTYIQLKNKKEVRNSMEYGIYIIFLNIIYSYSWIIYICIYVIKFKLN